MTAQPAVPKAQHYLQQGRGDLAILLLQQHLQSDHHDYNAWKLLGFACQDEQRDTEAVVAFSRAFALQPDDAGCLMALCQSRYFCGYSAVEQFYQLTQMTPSDLNAYRGLAKAFIAAGETALAEQLLLKNLAVHPAWLSGHKLLSSLRFTSGDPQHFADNYQQACQQAPTYLPLWLDWFRCYAQLKRWSDCARILAQAEQHCGSSLQLTLAKLVLAAESSDTAQARLLFQQTSQVQDLMRSMALLRFQLRHGELEQAEATALPWLNTASANLFWPYLSLIWRALNDTKAQWLDGEGFQVQAFDLAMSPPEITQLAAVLRQLHTAKAPYAEQSVRGGTQTDQNLLLRHEAPLQQLKQKIQQAVKSYVQQLPAMLPGHPLLGAARDRALQGRCRFAGSWSTLLKNQGFNVSHTHPMGWISAALHIEIPAAEQLGIAPAGWLQFGLGPDELALPVTAQQLHKPKAGTVVLFPSTLWHNTVPFDTGERLTVAFDVQSYNVTNNTIPGAFA